MSEAFEGIVQCLHDRAPKAGAEYMGKDGFLHCAKCHRKTETYIEIPEMKLKRIVRCVCDCYLEEQEKERLRKLQEENERNRRICFDGSELMLDWNFANDDRKNATISDAMQRYADDFAEHRRKNEGLLLYGNVGVGKTYFAACIAHRIIEQGYRARVTSVSAIVKQIQGTWEKQEQIDDMKNYDLIIFDDIGTERSSEFMQETVYDILDARYRSGLPFICTTNLAIDEIKKPTTKNGKRVYDRVLEKCHPVLVTGESRRRENVKKTFKEKKEALGL